MQANPINRRKKTKDYQDICALKMDTEEPLLFFGGKDYLPLFDRLTNQYRGKRTVFYNSTAPPNLPDCDVQKFDTNRRRKWHYECAQACLDGRLMQ